MFVALTQAGCEVEFVRYPGGAHGFTAAARRRTASTTWRARWPGSSGTSASRRATVTARGLVTGDRDSAAHRRGLVGR